MFLKKCLRSLSQDRGEKTELSDRGALENLLKAAAEEAGPGIRVIHEAKKVPGTGGPDFKVIHLAQDFCAMEGPHLEARLPALYPGRPRPLR
jgi:hypothetical protein